MIIPIGHEHTTVRRLPWVTFAIMALCLVAFITTQAANTDAEQRLGEELEAVFTYFMEHPYLELDARLQELVFAGSEEAGRELTEMVRRYGSKPPDSQLVRQGEQAELDRMVAAFFDTFYNIPHRRFGLVPADKTAHGLLTHMFIHGGWMHLLGNLFFLYLAGPFVEDVWGRPLYAVFYLCAGVVAGLMFAVRYPGFEGPLIGASGAIAGVMGAFLVRYWNTRIRFFYWVFFFFVGTFSAPAWLMLPVWFARELFVAQTMDVVAPGGGGAGAGVAYWAHVWGFVFGAGFAVAVRQLRVEDRFVDRAIEAKITVVDNPAVELAMERAADGHANDAMQILREELAARPDNDDAAVALWNLAARHGAPGDAAPHLLGLVRRAVRRGDLLAFRALWRELLDRAPESVDDPALPLRVAELLGAERDGWDEARETLEVAATAVQEHTPAGVLVRLARLAASLDSPSAAALIERAAAHPELPADARAEMEELGVRRGPCDPIPDDPVPIVAAEPDELLAAVPVEAVQKTLRVIVAVPTALSEHGVQVRTGGKTRSLAHQAIKAVSVAGIRESPPYLLVDLLLDPPWGDDERLRTLRVLSTGFDPRTVIGGTDFQSGYRSFLERLLRQSGAVPLPDPDRARGRPFAVYATLEDYEDALLGRD